MGSAPSLRRRLLYPTGIGLTRTARSGPRRRIPALPATAVEVGLGGTIGRNHRAAAGTQTVSWSLSHRNHRAGVEAGGFCERIVGAVLRRIMPFDCAGSDKF